MAFSPAAQWLLVLSHHMVLIFLILFLQSKHLPRLIYFSIVKTFHWLCFVIVGRNKISGHMYRDSFRHYYLPIVGCSFWVQVNVPMYMVARPRVKWFLFDQRFLLARLFSALLPASALTATERMPSLSFPGGPVNGMTLPCGSCHVTAYIIKPSHC